VSAGEANDCREGVYLREAQKNVRTKERNVMSEGSVDIKELVKTYVDDRGRPTFTAVKNISLHIENGEFMVLVGPSGCGKSNHAPYGRRS
jgi:ABC-type glutathione transport system ATPase component